jgi:hypothetical protein
VAAPLPWEKPPNPGAVKWRYNRGNSFPSGAYPMNRDSGVLTANQRVPHSHPLPRLRLLIELEPRHRVFFRNLADLVLLRPAPRIPITSPPARFWNDVFVPSGARWSSILESTLCHLLFIVLFVWIQSRAWMPVKLFSEQAASHRSVTYPVGYSFPAVESRAPSVRARPRVKDASSRTAASHQPAMPVTPEHRPGIVTPPDIKQATAELPNLVGSHAVAPMVPFSAAAGLRRNALAGSPGVVGPPPQVDQSVVRPPTLPQASAVGPAPELEGSSAARAMEAPNAGGVPVVPPPPSVLNAGNSSRAGRLRSGMGSLSGTEPNVVPPPPSAQGAGSAAGGARLGAMAGAGSQIVPPPPSVESARSSAGNDRISDNGPSLMDPQVVAPPPSVQGIGGPGGGTRLGSVSRSGSPVVPPPPLVAGAGNSGASGRPGSLSGDGSQVVPPPPSVAGAGHTGTSGRLGELSGDGSQVVPPPLSVAGAGHTGTSGRLGELSGDGSQVVPPPPSVAGAGNSGAGGRSGSLSEDGSQVAPPPRSVGGTGNPGASGRGKVLEPMDPLPVGDASITPSGNNENRSTVEELPLNSLGLVFAAPGTSYFSNFEVFVAKGGVGKDQMHLIKLVYEFLPYQRRLSEYDFNKMPGKVIKLRVTPDPSCKESLGHIMQPYTDPTRATTEYPKLPVALRDFDLNLVLPCYRTTADDFQKAMSAH